MWAGAEIKISLPKPGESAAISDIPKLAALCYNRVYGDADSKDGKDYHICPDIWINRISAQEKRRTEMNLKTATVAAIVGASLLVALGVVNLITIYVPTLAGFIYVGRGIIVNVLYLTVWVTFLIFFVTLYGKQK